MFYTLKQIYHKEIFIRNIAHQYNLKSVDEIDFLDKVQLVLELGVNKVENVACRVVIQFCMRKQQQPCSEHENNNNANNAIPWHDRLWGSLSLFMLQQHNQQ